MRREDILRQLYGPRGLVSRQEVDVLLEDHTQVTAFLGQHYRRLADLGALTEDLLPLDWGQTEAELDAMALKVLRFDDHWRQNPIGRTVTNIKANLYAGLAEIEGFQHLITNKDFDRVEALTFRRKKGQGAPDACCWLDEVPYLFEVKSLWAYLETRQNHLKPMPTGAYCFGPRPVGNSVVEANNLKLRRAGRNLDDGEHNTLLLDLTLRSLLEGASMQLRQYADRMGYGDCQKTILLVPTQRAPIISVVNTGRDMGRQWLAKHQDAVSEVEWYKGGNGADSWVKLGSN